MAFPKWVELTVGQINQQIKDTNDYKFLSTSSKSCERTMPNFVATEVIFFSGDLSVHKSCMSKIRGAGGKEEIRNWGINRTEIHYNNENCSYN